MAEQQINLFTLYKGWDVYQDLLTKAIAPLSPDQLALRAVPHLRSIGENTAHIIGTRVGWFHMLMGEGDAAIAPLDEWDQPNASVRSAAELVTGLEATWHMIQNALAHWTSADLDYIFQGTRDGKAYRFSRQWVIWHVIEHDLHHGGEISFMLGMHNLAAVEP
ncbi:MAG: DinB family protein [Chloroflexota bacterium]|nr:DinB family protein [Chloroflexota bacterium]